MQTFIDTQQIKYITDPQGIRQEVIVPVSVWQTLMAELDALREKQRLLLGLQQACREVKLQEQGQLPEQTLEAFINELQDYPN